MTDRQKRTLHYVLGIITGAGATAFNPTFGDVVVFVAAVALLVTLSGTKFIYGTGGGAKRKGAPWITFYVGRHSFGFPFGRSTQRSGYPVIGASGGRPRGGNWYVGLW